LLQQASTVSDQFTALSSRDTISNDKIVSPIVILLPEWMGMFASHSENQCPCKDNGCATKSGAQQSYYRQEFEKLRYRLKQQDRLLRRHELQENDKGTNVSNHLDLEM